MPCNDSNLFQKPEKIRWRGTEAVITGATRNRLCAQKAHRGFESHPLRQFLKVPQEFLTQPNIKVYKVTLFVWRGAREAEGARLEIVCTPKRCTVGSNPTLSANFVDKDRFLIAGSCATKSREPRQVRKEATVVGPFVCRRGAWLSSFQIKLLPFS